MAVYTKLEKEEIDNILLNYKLGKLKKFEGILLMAYSRLPFAWHAGVITL